MVEVSIEVKHASGSAQVDYAVRRASTRSHGTVIDVQKDPYPYQVLQSELPWHEPPP